MRALAAGAVAVILGLAATAARADVVHLTNGDRVTGRVVQERRLAITLQTPFGRLIIPRSRIDRIVREDGSTLAGPAAAAPSPSPSPAPPSTKVALIVTGKAFWYAWQKTVENLDPTLRLEVRLDEEHVAAYVDPRPDPEDLPEAVVNTFSFATPDLRVQASPGVSAQPPETRPGRVVLKLELPAGPGGSRRLRLAYQRNEGTAAEPAWRELAQVEAELSLQAGATTLVELKQDRGRMEFAGRRMRNVETFLMEIGPG